MNLAKTDCPLQDCQALKSVDADGYCNACARMVRLFNLGEIIRHGSARYVVSEIKDGKVLLSRCVPSGPELSGG